MLPFFLFIIFMDLIKLLSVQFLPWEALPPFRFIGGYHPFPALTIALMVFYFIWRGDTIGFTHPRGSTFPFSPNSNKIRPLKYAHSPFSCCGSSPASLAYHETLGDGIIQASFLALTLRCNRDGWNLCSFFFFKSLFLSLPDIENPRLILSVSI